MKCVFVLSSRLNIGQALNCCSLLATNLGASRPELIGEAPLDADGIKHSGLCSLPISVLKAEPEIVSRIVGHARLNPSLEIFDVTTISQKARKYSDVVEWTLKARASDLEYVGVALVGPKSIVIELSGTLELYR
jgi:hypothetical protein